MGDTGPASSGPAGQQSHLPGLQEHLKFNSPQTQLPISCNLLLPTTVPVSEAGDGGHIQQLCFRHAARELPAERPGRISKEGLRARVGESERGQRRFKQDARGESGMKPDARGRASRWAERRGGQAAASTLQSRLEAQRASPPGRDGGCVCEARLGGAQGCGSSRPRRARPAGGAPQAPPPRRTRSSQRCGRDSRADGGRAPAAHLSRRDEVSRGRIYERERGRLRGRP